MSTTAGAAAFWRPRSFLRIFPSPDRSPAPLLRGLGSAGVSSLALAIRTQEGWYPGSLSFRNNNPGNLIYVGQPGASPGDGGFARFASPDDGLAALERQITLDAGRGLTLGQFIRKYAPPTENDTAAYLASIEIQTGFRADDPLAGLQPGAAAPDTAAVTEAAAESAVLSEADEAATGTVGPLLVGVAIAAAVYLVASRL